MRKVPTRRAADGFGAPQAHRTLFGIIREISSIEDRGERIAALRAAPRAVREVLRFVYGNHALGLPKGPLSYTPISPRAFADEAGYPPDLDLLASEAHKLVRLFSREVIPHMTEKKRLSLWFDVMNRLTTEEREMLDHARMHRSLPWPSLSSAVVKEAFPGLLEMESTPERPPEGIEYLPSIMGTDEPIPEAPKPAPSREMTPEEQNYARLMRDLGFV